MKKLLLGSALISLLAAPVMADTQIGVTMTSFDNPFLTILLNGIRAEAEKTEGVTLSVEDAQLDVGRQLNQVQNFIANGVDAIIVNAVDGQSTAAITRAATDAGIPLIYVNHPPAELEVGMPAGTAYVGSDEADAGRLQAEAVCALLKGKEDAKAVILMGPLENRAAIVRTETVEAAFASPECPVEVVEKQMANWNRVQGQDMVASWLTAGVQFDAIISNNDEMAIGAAQAMKSVGAADVVIAGIDATVFQNAVNQGEVAVQTALAASGGATIEPEYWVAFEPVTKENMADYIK